MKLEIIRRSLMWLAGIALPATPLLQLRLRAAMKAVICAVCGGVLLGGVLVALCVGAYSLLVAQGTNPALAFGLLVLLGAILGGSLIMVALRQVDKAAHIKDDLSLFPKHGSDAMAAITDQLPNFRAMGRKGGAGFRDIASAFVDGLLTPAPTSVDRPSTMPVPPVSSHAEVDIKLQKANGISEIHIERKERPEDHAFL